MAMVIQFPSLSLWIQATRFHRPIGSLLLMIPMLLAFSLNPGMGPGLQLYFLALTILARSVGCIVNDYCDRDIDGLVERTKHRPFVDPSVQLSSIVIMVLILGALCCSCFFILPTSVFWYLVAAPFWILVYATAKRWFPLPQLILAIAFSWGIFIVAKTSFTTIPQSFWILFLANTLWVCSFDTTYAISDYKEDLNLPIHSIPKSLGIASSALLSSVLLVIAHGLILSLFPFNIFVYASSFFVILIVNKTIFIDKNNPQDVFYLHGLLGLLWVAQSHQDWIFAISSHFKS